jgi:SepF-like predicted cell division protein (DUF552 family)
MPFNLFRRKKEPEPQQSAVAPQEEPKQEAETAMPESMPHEETMEEPTVPEQEQPTQEQPQQEAVEPTPTEEQPQETTPAPMEQKQETAEPPPAQKPAAAPSKTYLKAMPLREISELENIKNEVRNGNIIILKVTPLATKSIEDVKNAVNELFQFSETIGGDIARLGEERVVICPKTVRIWREKTPAPVSTQQLPTAAA